MMRRYVLAAFLAGFLSACMFLCWGQPKAAFGGTSEVVGPGGATVVPDEHEMRVAYVNAFRINTGQEEVIMDLGFSMRDPDAAASGTATKMLFRVQDRVVMTYGNAKLLGAALGAAVKRYEAQSGEIKTPQH